ncbi:UDP-glucose 4-epimerase, partial [Pectobacterium polonicum]
TLVQALLKITNKLEHQVNIIGTRHGEKLYEALCSREEMFVSEDQGGYYRIPSDNRDLNYSKYNEIGDKDLSSIQDYNSHNTDRLDVDAMITLLHKLDFISDIERGSLVVPEGV